MSIFYYCRELERRPRTTLYLYANFLELFFILTSWDSFRLEALIVRKKINSVYFLKLESYLPKKLFLFASMKALLKEMRQEIFFRPLFIFLKSFIWDESTWSAGQFQYILRYASTWHTTKINGKKLQTIVPEIGSTLICSKRIQSWCCYYFE